MSQVVLVFYVLGVIVFLVFGTLQIGAPLLRGGERTGRIILVSAPVWPALLLFWYLREVWQLVGPTVRSWTLRPEKRKPPSDNGPYRTGPEVPE